MTNFQKNMLSAIELIQFFFERSGIKYSSKENVIIDGGFFKGHFSLAITKVLKEFYCYAFEPNNMFYELWNRSESYNKRIILYPLALSSQNGVAEIHISESYPGTSSLLPRPSDTNMTKPYYPKNAISIKRQLVETIPIDDFCKKEGIKSIFLLKLDLQGGEEKALIGAKKMLESNSIAIIYTEAVFVQKYKDQPLMLDLWRMLIKYGYRLHSVYDVKSGSYDNSVCELRKSQLNQCNCLFVSKAMSKLYD